MALARTQDYQMAPHIEEAGMTATHPNRRSFSHIEEDAALSQSAPYSSRINLPPHVSLTTASQSQER